MKINIIYIIWFAALSGFLYIAKDLKNQSGQQLFGIAETEGQTMKIESAVFVQKCKVATGKQVRKGDTLLVLFRSDLDKRTTDKITELNQLTVERDANNVAVVKDWEVFSLKQTARISELNAQIKLLENEIKLQNNLKQAISEGKVSDTSSKQQQINALYETIRQVNIQTQEQQQVFDSQRISNNNISASRAKQVQNELGFIGKERLKLVLFAPFDGFIEQVYVTENEIVPNYKDLLKINPQVPNKIIGFIHESLNIPYRIGDTVLLSSTVRPTIKLSAQLIGASPKLVELPFRLRKFTEIKAWGREIYINLPPNNDFYIGEKISIQIKR
jgi:hypothetical protein